MNNVFVNCNSELQMGYMTWRESVVAALKRAAQRGGSTFVTRADLIRRELPRIVRETGSTGVTPAQTLSRVLQELRDDRQVKFTGRGEYQLIGDEVL